MPKWTDADELKKLARFIEGRTDNRVALTTYSPGDGVTRYRLGIYAFGFVGHDYFGDRALVTALGRREALTMCRAYLAGLDERG